MEKSINTKKHEKNAEKGSKTIKNSRKTTKNDEKQGKNQEKTAIFSTKKDHQKTPKTAENSVFFYKYKGFTKFLQIISTCVRGI